MGNSLLQCNLVIFLYFVRFLFSDPQELQRLCVNVLRLVVDVILDEKPNGNSIVVPGCCILEVVYFIR